MHFFPAILDKVIFHKDDFIIGAFHASTERFTAKGIMFSPSEGETYILHGDWETSKYGRQFAFQFYEKPLPKTESELLPYFKEAKIPGLGQGTAKKMVAAFGLKTIEILDEDPIALAQLKGVSEEKALKIGQGWKDFHLMRDLNKLLGGAGVNPVYITKAVRAYGSEALKVVSETPYRLTEISGITFPVADRIALHLGYSKDHPARVEGAIVWVLEKASQEGHTFLPMPELQKRLQKDLQLKWEGKDRYQRILVDSENRVYLRWLYEAEKDIARFISQTRETVSFEVSTLPDLGIAYNEDQEAAVRGACKSQVSIITGGPGVGKTTVIKALCHLLPNVALAAPTGRAAKRMTEATGFPASTLHRLLEYNPELGFQRNEINPLTCENLIVDEVSMVGVTLCASTFAATPRNTRIILVGDPDQIPSVDAGNILGDLINSRTVPVFRLQKIYRQKEGSLIIDNAHRILKGAMPLIPNGKEDDTFFISAKDADQAIEKIIDLVGHRLPDSGIDPRDIQIISPLKKGVTGTENINAQVQRLYQNPESVHLTKRFFQVGDRVIQIKNNYQKEIFNGDIGYIDRIDLLNQVLIVQYDDCTVEYAFSELDQITLAYAITVHKSQGSEFPIIIMPVLLEHKNMLQRNLFYTGKTRGKRMLILVGQVEAVKKAIGNHRQNKRLTTLRERLAAA